MLNPSMANMIILAINSYTTAQVEPHQIGICNVTKFTLASLLLKFAMFEFAIHSPHQTKFDSEIHERTRKTLYVHEVLGLYIFVSQSFSFIISNKHE